MYYDNESLDITATRLARDLDLDQQVLFELYEILDSDQLFVALLGVAVETQHPQMVLARANGFLQNYKDISGQLDAKAFVDVYRSMVQSKSEE